MRYHNKSLQKTVTNGGKKSDTTAAKCDIIYYYYGEHNYANPKKKEKNS